MAHIPLIHGPDGSKLSKRHGALGVDAYRAMGYLPAAMRNYLVRLGWAHGDQEIFSTEEMIAAFDLPQIGRSPARFDFAKLESLNGHYIRHDAPTRDLLAAIERAAAASRRAARELAGQARRRRCASKLMAAMPGLKERAKTLVELVDARALHLGGPAAARSTTRPRALLDAEARGAARATLLAELRRRSRTGRAEATEAAVRAFAERQGVKLGAVAQPLRAALTGRTTSPGIFDVLAVLGRERKPRPPRATRPTE